MFVVRAFYKFVTLNDVESLQTQIQEQAVAYGLKGSIILATEGINSTISATPENMESFWDFLTSLPNLDSIEFKDAKHEAQPFKRMKVNLKPEIVTLRNSLAKPADMVGEYVDPTDWNELIKDPEVILVDTRNDYEVIEGTFKGAVDPKTNNFPQFPDWVDSNLNPKEHKRIAMFCTGGIRCEKATSLLLAKGFEKVYHLRGGILKYLEVIPEEESLFEGSCFVFDERQAVVTGLKPELRKHEQETR